MKKLLLLLIIPLLSFGQNENSKNRKLELTSVINTGVSFFGNSTKTNMDFGIKLFFSSDSVLAELGWEKVGFGVSSSFIFDSKSNEEFRAHGDINFLDFILYFKTENLTSTLTLGFLLRDDSNLFYDDVFRMIFTQQIIENLYVSGGFYLDRDKKPHKNTRHDLPMFGLSYHF
jgi:hypothetical protein